MTTRDRRRRDALNLAVAPAVDRSAGVVSSSQPAEEDATLDIYRLFRIQANQHPSATAIVAPGRTALTYAGLLWHVEQLGATLRSLQIGRGDCVAVVLPNGPEMAATALGVGAWAISVPLNPAHRLNEFDAYFSELNVKALIAQRGIDTAAIAAARARGLSVVELVSDPEAGAGRLEPRADMPSGPSLADRARAGEVAVVLLTSGTTSRPKFVALTHENVCASALQIARTLRLGPSDRGLNVMPLFHVHGLIGSVLSSLASGATVICTSGFDSSTFLAHAQEFQPTWYTAVPPIHQAILALAGQRPGTWPPSRLRLIRSASAPLSSNVLAGLERAFGVPVIEAYGLTEASHQVSSNPLPPAARKPDSVGMPAGAEVAVIDEAGNILPPNEAGEIVIRGRGVTKGYVNNTADTANAFIRGWFRTGDQGYLDADGYLFITGRLKDIINRGGSKVSPREVDDALLHHPAVAAAATVAVPHSTLGEDVASAVVLRAGASASERQIHEFAAGRLVDYKVPRHIVFLDSIPTSPTGKLDRRHLAKQLSAILKHEFATPQTPAEQTLAGIFAGVLGIERVGARDNFFELGGDSLSAARAFALVEERFGRNLPLATLFHAPTVEQLAGILSDEEWKATWSSLVPIQPNGSRPRFFCVHGIGGNVLIYRALARFLGTDQPFYGLQSVGLDGVHRPHTRIEDMAHQYVKEIRDLQPAGPYFLGGASYGGLIALEVAQILHAQGHQVPLLAVFDTSLQDNPALVRQSTSFLAEARFFSRRLAFHALNLKRLPMRQRIQYVVQKARTLQRRIRSRVWQRRYGALPDPQNALPRALADVAESNRLAEQHYVPRPYPGRVTLIRAAQQGLTRHDDPLLGWGSFASGGVDVHEVPGDHVTILQDPHVRALARELRRCLDGAIRSSNSEDLRARASA